MIDFFFNYLAMPLIFGVVLFYVISWIWVICKADRFVHKQFEKPPHTPTPEEKAASLARVLKMMKAEQTPAHHH
jgi:hypothetical protein